MLITAHEHMLICSYKARLDPMARSAFFVRGSPDTTAKKKLISLCAQMYNFSYSHVFCRFDFYPANPCKNDKKRLTDIIESNLF